MKCKYCGAELEGNITRCPACGAEDAVASNKLSAGKIALLAILVIAAVAVVLGLVMSGTPSNENPSDATVPSVTLPAGTVPADGNPDDVTCKGSYTVSDEVLAGELEKVIATVGNESLSNEELQVYYWMEFYNFLEQFSSYMAYFGMNVYEPLDTQVSLNAPLTWQQNFLDSALGTWHSYAALGEAARAAGFEMAQEYTDELAAHPASLDASAKKAGFANAQEMIQADMGPGGTLEAYMAFMQDYYLGNLYYTHYLEQIEVTDEDVKAYFDEHKDEYAKNGLDENTRFVDVRHILIMPQGGTTENGVTTYSDAEWETCRQTAQALLDAYLAGEQTEERFAAFARENSEDPGSKSNGGLYTDVYVGQMVEPFEDWCFDESRETGNTGLVKTNYGYHIMYFVDSSEAWYDTAWGDLINDKGDAYVAELMKQYPMEVDYSSIALGLVEFSAEG